MKKLIKNEKELLLIAGTIFVISLIVFRKYIFEGYHFLSQDFLGDLLRANLPTYYQMYDSISEGGYFWSWRMGIGTSMFSHADVYFDPFTYILFIFGRDSIPAMMIWLFVVKLMAEGICFYMYLDHFHLDKRSSAIASILYAFCGYSMIMGSNFALGTILVYAPLILLGIEKWIDEKKIWTLFISLFLTCIYSYYFFYIMGLLSALYLIIRLIQRKYAFISKLVVLALLALIVIGMSAFSLLPQIQLVLASPRISNSKDVSGSLLLFMPQLKVWLTAVVRALCVDILGNRVQHTYLGYGYFNAMDYFQISCYSSAFLVVLLAQYWENEKDKRKNILFVVGVLFTLISFPFFSYALNFFTTISARWMFIVSIIECLGIALSIDSIINKGKINSSSLKKGILLSLLIIMGGIVALGLASNNKITHYINTGKRFIIAILFLYALFVLLYFMQEKAKTVKIIRNAFYIIIFIIIIFDVGINYFHTYGIAQSVCDYTEENNSSYDDKSAKIIGKIQDKDSSVYRINKDFDSVIAEEIIPSENDAMVQGYFGLKSYNSLNNAQYIKFLQTSDVYVSLPSERDFYIENNVKPKEVFGSSLNYINGVYDRYQLMSYLGVKYYITKEEKELPEYFSFLYEEDGIKVYENNNYFPIAFVNSEVIPLSLYEQLTDIEKDNALIRYTIIDDNFLATWKPKKEDAIDLNEIALGKQNSFLLTSFSEDNILFEINVEDNSEYLSLTIPYDCDWHIYIDGEEVDTIKVNVAMLGTKITPGKHMVQVVYKPKMFYIGLVISFGIAIVLLAFCKKVTTCILGVEEVINKILKNGLNFMGKLYYGKKLRRIIISFISAIVALASGAGIACTIQEFTSGSVSIRVVLVLAALIVILECIIIKKIAIIKQYKRDTNIELCRVVCMLAIIAHHFVIHGGSFAMERMSSNRIFSLFLVPGGKLCFDCFLAISCWFLVDQDFKTKRVLKIWGTTFFYSVVFAMIALLWQHDFSLLKLKGAFFPITGNSHGFAAAYIAFYLILPFLSKMASGLTKKKARWLMILLLYFEVGSQFIGCINGYYQPFASEILLFVLFYFIAFNLKKWPLPVKQNKGVMIMVFLGIWFILWAARYNQVIDPNNHALNIFMATMCDESSITNIVGGFALFFFFKNVKMKCHPFINYLATSTLGILLIHDHNYFRYVLWNNIYNTTEWSGYRLREFIVIIICVTFAIYIVCFIIDQLRNVLIEKPLLQNKYVKVFCDKIDKIMNEEGRN